MPNASGCEQQPGRNAESNNPQHHDSQHSRPAWLLAHADRQQHREHHGSQRARHHLDPRVARDEVKQRESLSSAAELPAWSRQPNIKLRANSLAIVIGATESEVPQDRRACPAGTQVAPCLGAEGKLELSVRLESPASLMQRGPGARSRQIDIRLDPCVRHANAASLGEDDRECVGVAGRGEIDGLPCH